MKDLDAVIGELRGEKYGVTCLGAQGFCWGGFYSVHLTSQGDKVDRAAGGYALHQS